MGKAKPVDDRPALPTQARVGDLIRLKEAKIKEYERACESAGWQFDGNAIYTVLRDDGFLPGGGRRLFINVPPHALGSRDVELAWSNEEDRRVALRAKGLRV